MKARAWMIVMVLGMAATVACGQPRGDERVAVTVYNGNFGVVRELRRLDIGADGEVQFTDVAAAIDPTTVHFRSLTDPKAKLLEQNYRYDLVSADRLLRQYIDRRITVIADGASYEGALLSFDAQQLILRTDEGLTMVRRGEHVRDIRFGALPEGLLTRPTLLWLVATDTPGDHLAEVTYQTGRINWHAEYVLVLNDEDTAADLSGWVSVDNQSGKTYRDARLKFIAGDVRRIQPPPAARELMMRAGGVRMDAEMETRPFFEYHMYSLPRPSTLADNETKQLEMFTPVRGLSVAKRFLYNPLDAFRWHGGGRHTDRSYGADTGDTKVNIFIEFRNSEANNLGIPLPAGKVRVYKQDTADEALEFVGEERIDHTPRNEELSLHIGNAFDIVGERKQVNFRIESGRNWMQERIEIRLRNQKQDEDVVVRVKEPLFRWRTWRITAESAEHTQLDSRTVAWDLRVPAEGETVLTYTVEYTW